MRVRVRVRERQRLRAAALLRAQLVSKEQQPCKPVRVFCTWSKMKRGKWTLRWRLMQERGFKCVCWSFRVVNDIERVVGTIKLKLQS